MDEMPEKDPDHEAIMDHVALECMNAIQSKDKEAFMQALEVLVSDLVSRMQSPDGGGES